MNIYFLSLYGYVTSKSFKIKVDPSDSSENNLINIKLEQLGGLTLIPLVDLCLNSANLYMPDESLGKTNYQIITGDEIKIFSLKNYSKSQELSLSSTENLSNDFLLINYGMLLKNNPHQEFIFKFDIIDKDYNFYNSLRSNGFNISMITIIDEHKLSIRFNLKSSEISVDLLKFIEIFLNMFGSRDDEKFHKNKNHRNLLNSIDKRSLKKLKNHLLYYLTIEKNIRKIFEDAEIKDINSFYDYMIETKKKISKSNQIIKSNTEKFYEDRNLASFVDDDFQNLFYFKTLHTLIKRDLIQEFNFENVKILFSQEEVALNNAMKNFYKNIKQLKRKYI